MGQGAVHKLRRHLGGGKGKVSQLSTWGRRYLEGFLLQKKAKIVHVGEGGSKFSKKCPRILWMATKNI